jgi:hypothetical protein
VSSTVEAASFNFGDQESECPVKTLKLDSDLCHVEFQEDTDFGNLKTPERQSIINF